MTTYIETRRDKTIVIDELTRPTIARMTGVPINDLIDQPGAAILSRVWFDARTDQIVAMTSPAPRLGLFREETPT